MLAGEDARLLVLPNVWDAFSAAIVAASGARAIATGSAALAWARGAADGEALPLEDLVDVVRRIASTVKLPVTVDFERGYAADPAVVAVNVARVVEAGACGVNLEDGGGDPDLLAEKVGAVRARLGDAVFVNARTCVVIRRKVDASSVVEEVSRRARIFAQAGADGLFVPALVDPAAIEAIAAATKLPLNVLLSPGLPGTAELVRLGVRRLTIGPRLAELAYGVARRAARDLMEKGDYAAFFGPDIVGFVEANAMFTPPADR